MAQRRMFSLKIIDTDAFLDMPISARELYFQFGMRADDDGFVGNPKRIMKMIGASDDDIKILVVKKFIIPFESGVCVISDWKIHNYIQSDRYQETHFKLEKGNLKEKEGRYELTGNVSKMDTQVRKELEIGKSKDRLEREDTPAQKTKEFFINNELQEKIVLSLKEKGGDENSIRREINKFVSYWTELNKSGTKQRWELEKTFEVNRRLTTWFNRIKEFQGRVNLGVIKV